MIQIRHLGFIAWLGLFFHQYVCLRRRPFLSMWV
jgi:hypothetical protein